MNCMKCGRETYGENIFCQECLAEMREHPVDPGAVVLLPRRKEASSFRKPVRHTLSPEEQVVLLRRWVLGLTAALVLCLAAISVMLKHTLHYLRDEHVEMGQNYSTIVQTTAPPKE